eukprot:CAMPEP_0117444912 /NCGR_PEP_ID=MMETSP0759-20121206/5509_1 /TAXON_ID=63605 /ORGANISM="Percolomonas cosmopolitus, Strain WS" /LENGTH=263 /DNA_ID=CAMNT_0005237041 /DNA_START=8 /DNA_END=799 /DNA_ORIENTATION=-
MTPSRFSLKSGSILFLAILFLFQFTCHVRAQADRIKESDISVLTLSANEYAVCRRSCPAPKQLSCSPTLGSTCSHPAVSAQCQNMGTDDRGRVNWKCTSELDQRVRFANLKVSCEGYDRAGDEYVLKGSCILEYGLQSTGGGGGDGPDNRGFLGLLGVIPCLCLCFGGIGLFICIAAILNRARGPSYAVPPPPVGYAEPRYYGRSWRPGFFSGFALGRFSGHRHHHHHGGFHHHHNHGGGGRSWGGGGGHHTSTGFATSSSSR